VQHFVVGAGDLVDLGDAAPGGPYVQVAFGHRPALAGEVLQRRGQHPGLTAGDKDSDGQRNRGHPEQQQPGDGDPVPYGNGGS
jgi:hypothetical protein